jgi:hypothetical protein
LVASTVEIPKDLVPDTVSAATLATDRVPRALPVFAADAADVVMAKEVALASVKLPEPTPDKPNAIEWPAVVLLTTVLPVESVKLTAVIPLPVKVAVLFFPSMDTDVKVEPVVTVTPLESSPL